MVYQAGVRTFPLTVTVAVVWISTNIWNTSKRLNGYWLMAIWFVSIYVSIGLAAHFGCDDCGKLRDITEQTNSWVPKSLIWGGYLVAFLITAVIYFFELYGWASFVASLICGSYLGLAGIYVLRPGGPLDRNGKLE